MKSTSPSQRGRLFPACTRCLQQSAELASSRTRKLQNNRSKYSFIFKGIEQPECPESFHSWKTNVEKGARERVTKAKRSRQARMLLRVRMLWLEPKESSRPLTKARRLWPFSKSWTIGRNDVAKVQEELYDHPLGLLKQECKTNSDGKKFNMGFEDCDIIWQGTAVIWQGTVVPLVYISKFSLSSCAWTVRKSTSNRKRVPDW